MHILCLHTNTTFLSLISYKIHFLFFVQLYHPIYIYMLCLMLISMIRPREKEMWDWIFFSFFFSPHFPPIMEEGTRYDQLLNVWVFSMMKTLTVWSSCVQVVTNDVSSHWVCLLLYTQPNTADSLTHQPTWLIVITLDENNFQCEHSCNNLFLISWHGLAEHCLSCLYIVFCNILCMYYHAWCCSHSPGSEHYLPSVLPCSVFPTLQVVLWYTLFRHVSTHAEVSAHSPIIF